MADDLDGSFANLEQARKDLEHATVIMARLNETAAERMKEHAQLIAEEQEYRREQKKRDEILDKRIEQLFSGIGE